jgi:hypothetical protein
MTPKNTIAILEHNTKIFADYMAQESKSSSPFFDGDVNSLRNSCKYPFMQKDGQWVSIKDLKQCSRLLGDNVDDGDIYLSYSFFQLLTRRYFGFHCAEEGDSKVRDFVLMELLQPDYKRAFVIVEVQLSLLLDYFFTFYHPITILASLPQMQSHKGKPRIKHKSNMAQVSAAAITVWWPLYLFIAGSSAFGVSRSAFYAVASIIFAMLIWFNKNPVYRHVYRLLSGTRAKTVISRMSFSFCTCS